MKTIISKINTILAFAIFSLFIITACSKDSGKGGGDGKTGTFSIDGTSYKGETETQTFVNDNYSIVCQQDDPFKLIQITFHNKAEAETGGTFDVEDFGLNVNSGAVQIGVDGNSFDPENDTYTISVSNKKISIGSINLIQTGTGAEKPTVNSASINF